MILYTPLSEAEIFPHSTDEFSKRHFVSHEGKSLYAEQNTDGSYQLLQLLSTNPQDFLEEKYAPGTIFHLNQH
ncbi:YlzJ-like family protein [Virgibacillus ainsalahensis]